MPRRILAASAAALLAITGAVVLFSWANGADERARADEDLVSVLVLGSEVPAGTPAADVLGSAVLTDVPSRLVAEDAIKDADLESQGLDGKVSAVPLLPGEQLRAARFTVPSRVADPGTVAAPDGAVEVSVTLDAQRALGGALRPGDTVGVQLAEASLSGILVTRVSAPDNATDPNASYLVTLALTKDQARSVVASSASAPVWLSLELRSGRDAGAAGTTTVTATLGENQ